MKLSQSAILTENKVYKRLSGSDISFVPQYYGLYEWPGGVALLLSDKGESLDASPQAFKELYWWRR